MALFGVATVLLAAVALRGLGASRERTVAALALVAGFPLLLGSVVLTRFDLYPAALVAAALAALVHRRDRLGFGLLGAAVAVKLYPAVLVPVALGYVWRRRGRREALVCLALCVGVVALAYRPVPGRRARRRRAQPRAAALAAAPDREPRLGALPRGTSPRRPRRRNALRPRLAEPLRDGNRGDGGPAQRSCRSGSSSGSGCGEPVTSEELVRWSAAALVAFVALGKVLSPQFLIWLVPAVPLVAGIRGLRASVLLAVALVLTQLWFPSRYWDLARELDPLPSTLVLLRDLVLVAVLVVLVRDRRESVRSP